jgi:hypothetical protein
MTPKEKAKQLVNDMLFETERNCQPSITYLVSKKCALICLREIFSNNTDESKNDYWIEVKEEIELL